MEDRQPASGFLSVRFPIINAPNGTVGADVRVLGGLSVTS
jgi:hypothetical protein